MVTIIKQVLMIIEITIKELHVDTICDNTFEYKV